MTWTTLETLKKNYVKSDVLIKTDKAKFTNQSKAYEMPSSLGLVKLTVEHQACTEVVFEPRNFEQNTNVPSIQK